METKQKSERRVRDWAQLGIWVAARCNELHEIAGPLLWYSGGDVHKALWLYNQDSRPDNTGHPDNPPMLASFPLRAEPCELDWADKDTGERSLWPSDCVS